MADSFQPDVNQQLLREAKFSLGLLLVTALICGYFIFQRIQEKTRIPEHVRNAPSARVHPDPREASGNESTTSRSAGQARAERLARLAKRNGMEYGSSRSQPVVRDGRPRAPQGSRQESSEALQPDGVTPDARASFAERSNSTDFAAPPATEAQPRRIAAPSPEDIPGVPSQLVQSRDSLRDGQTFQPGRSRLISSPTSETGKATLRAAPARRPAGSSFEPPVSSAEPGSDRSRESSPPLDANSFPEESSTLPTPNAFAGTTPLQPSRERSDNPTADEASAFPARPPRPGAMEGEVQMLTIGPDESLWSVCQHIYGDGRYFRALFAENELRLPVQNESLAGIQIEIPSEESLRRKWPKLCPDLGKPKTFSEQEKERVYTTSEGDTLFQLARQRLGQASRYLEIIEMNRFRLPSNVTHLTPLPAGLKLLLPSETPLSETPDLE